jgi:hypothetical protein
MRLRVWRRPKLTARSVSLAKFEVICYLVNLLKSVCRMVVTWHSHLPLKH